jgi:hypothetical protein
MAMNPEIKAKWVAALRSGMYRQGRMQLRNRDDEFCCLGVLCDIYAGSVSGAEWEQRRAGGYRIEDNDSLLPVEVVDWAGLPGTWGPRNGDVDVVGLNDDKRADFGEIADFIEQYA